MLLLAFGLAFARDPASPVKNTASDPMRIATMPQAGMPVVGAPQGGIPAMGMAQGAMPAVGATQAGWLTVAGGAPVVQYAPPQAGAGAAPANPYAAPNKQVHFLSFAPTIKAGAKRPHGDRGTCTNCHDIVANPQPATTPAALPAAAQDNVAGAVYQGGYGHAPGAAAAAGFGQSAPYGGQVAATGAAPDLVAPRSPTTAQGVPQMLPFQEAHWQGIEAISVSPGLARVLGMPRRSRGVVIDEVTMPADVQGFGAGDLITAVGGRPTPSLEEFIDAADRVRDESSVVIDVMRKGEPKKIVLSARRLGTASGETAPMIPAGARAPHGYQGPCTNCHRIGTGGSLAVDLGDVLSKSAPPIYWGQPRPHQDRGPCTACHTIR